jgi:hypothetical protein
MSGCGEEVSYQAGSAMSAHLQEAQQDMLSPPQG